MADPNNIQAGQQYRTAIAERGKFWPVDTDYLNTLGYPASGEGKYATLTYQINSVPLTLSGDVMIESDVEQIPGTTANTKISQQGGIAEETTPTPVSDGDAVAVWYDLYGRQVLAGYNTSLSAIDVNSINSVPSLAEQSPSGVTANTNIIQTGGIAEATIPSPVSDGDAVATWFDVYGKQVIAGYNQSLDALDVNNVNDPLLSRLGPTSHGIAASGATANVDVSNYHNYTIHIIATGSPDATIQLEHSVTGADAQFVPIGSPIVLSSVGNTEIAISNQAYRYIRLNATSYVSGTITAFIYAGN